MVRNKGKRLNRYVKDYVVFDLETTGINPAEDEIIEMHSFIGQDILVGHNIHTFDTNFLYDGAMRELGRPVKNDYIDTLYMAKSCLPQLKHYKLTDISQYFGIGTEGAHRALNDCNMNQQCYERMGKLLPPEKESMGDVSVPACP